MRNERSAGWYERRDGSMSFWNGVQWTESTPPMGHAGAAHRESRIAKWLKRK